MHTRRGLVRLAELHEGNFAAPEIDDEGSGTAAAASGLGAPDDVRVEVDDHRLSLEWPLGGFDADEVTATLMGRLFVVRAESEDHTREAEGAMLLPFELVPDETVASVGGGVLKLQGPLAKG